MPTALSSRAPRWESDILSSEGLQQNRSLLTGQRTNIALGGIEFVLFAFVKRARTGRKISKTSEENNLRGQFDGPKKKDPVR